MRDLNETVQEIGRLTGCDGEVIPRIHTLVTDLLVDQVMSLANAIAPTGPDEQQIVDWLQSRLVGIARQIKYEKEKKA